MTTRAPSAMRREKTSTAASPVRAVTESVTEAEVSVLPATQPRPGKYLKAEGVGADVTMIVGNGYTKGHAEITLQELRENAELRKIFEELYA